MPYLDSKIETSKHKKSCKNPVGKRLYIRDYNDKGKPSFVSWGLTCTTCGVVIKENYNPNLTPKQLKDRENHKKLEETKLIKRLGLTDSWEERLESHQRYKTARKLRRLQRRANQKPHDSKRDWTSHKNKKP